MTDLLSNLLSLVALYGYPIVAGIIFAGYMGIPVPSEGVLLAAGALTAEEEGGLNFYLLIAIAATVAICGDLIAYFIGKRFGLAFVDRYGKYISVNRSLIQSLSQMLNKWGTGLIFITRWLLTPLGIPLSLLSGITGYSFKYFLIAVCLGELLWVTIFVYLGYLLGSNWLVIYDYLNNFFWLILTASAGLVLLYLGIRMYRNRTF